LEEWRYGSTHSLTSALDGVECQKRRIGLYVYLRTDGTPETRLFETKYADASKGREDWL